MNRTIGAIVPLKAASAAISLAGPLAEEVGLRTHVVGSFVSFVLACGSAGAAHAQLDQLTQRDAAAGLRAALEKGSQAAVAQLGHEDGFFGDARVKIPLPESLAKAEKLMRRVGLGDRADELVLAMNRAAESAVLEAKPLFVAAVKKMTLQDAKGILTGGDTAGTEYFRRATSEPLHAKFLPIVKRATAKVRLAQKYEAYAEKGARFGLVRQDQAKLEVYVTGRALAGLFLMVGEEEKKIRKDPAGAASGIIKKVFGALTK